VEAPLHRDWIGRTIRDLEEATGARVAYLMRFGIGSLATPSTVLQDGDQVFVLVTDDMVGPVLEVASGSDKGGH
jgi:trk system potassium uptake protein TrkA